VLSPSVTQKPLITHGVNHNYKTLTACGGNQRHQHTTSLFLCFLNYCFLHFQYGFLHDSENKEVINDQLPGTDNYIHCCTLTFQKLWRLTVVFSLFGNSSVKCQDSSSQFPLLLPQPQKSPHPLRLYHSSLSLSLSPSLSLSLSLPPLLLLSIHLASFSLSPQI